MTATRRAVLGGGLLASAAAVVATRRVIHATEVASRSGHDLGALPDVLRDLDATPNGIRVDKRRRLALVRYDAPAEMRALHADVAAGGVLALVNVCTHLGCSIPEVCESSGWFECACHGARFNRAGDYEFGPAVRGMDRYRLSLRPQPGSRPDRLVVDLTRIVPGLPRGSASVVDPARGAHCMS